MSEQEITVSESDTVDVEPDVTVVEVRGEKEIGFKGMKHLEMAESDKDKIHDVYSDIIIELDDVNDSFEGVDRAWHVGRVLQTHDVRSNPEMTFVELGAYNTIDQMYARRLQYAENIYEFWPEQDYDPEHSVTALGELASRARTENRVTEARNGYSRLLENEEMLGKDDVYSWYELDPVTVDNPLNIERVVSVVSTRFGTPSGISQGVKRTVLLLDQPLHAVSKAELKTAIQSI